MKLIYLHQYFKFPYEAGGTRSYDLAKEFVRENHRVEVVASTSDLQQKSNKRWNIVQEDGLIVHYIYLPYSNEFSYLRRTFIFLQFLWFSTFRLLAIKGDLVLATSTPLTIGIPALVKKWIHRTPFIFETRDVWPEAVIAIGAVQNRWIQKCLYWFEKLIYREAAAIVPLSTDMEKSITERYPELEAKPVVVIENIASLERFKGYDANRSFLQEHLNYKPRFTILYAGTFGKVNGIAYVVEMAAQVLPLDPTIVFVLIGEGAEKQEVIDLAIAKNILNKNLFILDPVAKDDLPQIYHEVQMGSSFVIPIKELWANSANKFFDTLAASKPILINHGGWQKSVIHSENVGYVLPSALSGEAVREFVAYTQNLELHQVQCANALTTAKRSYSLEVASRKYLELFKKLT